MEKKKAGLVAAFALASCAVIVAQDKKQEFKMLTLERRLFNGCLIHPPTVLNPFAFQAVHGVIWIVQPLSTIESQRNTAGNVTGNPRRQTTKGPSGFHDVALHRNMGRNTLELPYSMGKRIFHGGTSR